MKNRLSKVLAACGVASRRRCEELIHAGRVKVNGRVVRIPQEHVDTEHDVCCVDGSQVGVVEKRVYYILNKPCDHLCTNSEYERRNRVIDLFHGAGKRLFTVGRLDRETTGLLLVTNDGFFAQQVIHPSSNIEKEYLVEVSDPIKVSHLTTIRRGCFVEGSYVTPLEVEKQSERTLTVIVKEGKKREVRCLVKKSGLTIHALMRIRIGKLLLGDLPKKKWRPLTEQEKRLIFS
ncbi:rRNA pseudouridine synthase [Simkania negevensis]|uniref:Pseudouridine synthase n=1 Tax=Simkania negevensis TaxID=83561 RepID=A0ABS3AQD3_9BACT|nr:rRNA pseudouridine synthase [Simkania negevensis]